MSFIADEDIETVFLQSNIDTLFTNKSLIETNIELNSGIQSSIAVDSRIDLVQIHSSTIEPTVQKASKIKKI